MERKEELLSICQKLDTETLKLVSPLIEQLIFLEKQLDFLKTLPFILVKPDDSSKQKVTPAYKQYKDLSQTYINALKIVNSALGIESDTIESPLRQYMEARIKERTKEHGGT